MPYNMFQYIDEVKARLSRYDISTELDDGFLEMIINRSRRDVQMATVSLFPERYGRIRTLSSTPSAVTAFQNDGIKFFGIALPTDVLDVIAVEVRQTGADDTKWWSARKLSKREMWGVSRQTYNKPTVQDPVYVLERNLDSETTSLYVSKGSEDVVANQVKIYYVAALPFLERFPVAGSPDVERKMSWEYEELVVLIAIVRALEKTQFLKSQPLIQADIETAVAMIEETYKTGVDMSKLLLPTRQSLVPNVPMPENIAINE